MVLIAGNTFPNEPPLRLGFGSFASKFMNGIKDLVLNKTSSPMNGKLVWVEEKTYTPDFL